MAVAPQDSQQGSQQALGDLRVVDMTNGIAGAMASMFLADFGATVVKVEPPGGDPTRANPGFAVWNRGKRSLVADLDDPAGLARAAALLRSADVLLHAEPADSPLERSLLEAAANPRLVVVRMPPWIDANIPWAGGESNQLLSAAMGISMRQSSWEDGPVDPVYAHLLYLQGIWATACALSALVERESSGAGQGVTVSGPHGALVAGGATFLVDTTATKPAPPPGPGGPNAFYTRYRCADGQWLFLGSLTPKFQLRALAALGLEDLLKDERLNGSTANAMQPGTREWLRAAITEAFASQPREHWLTELEKADCPAGPLGDRDDWLDHPQIKAIGMRVELDDPDRGHVVMPGQPLVLTGSPAVIDSPAPALDEAAGSSEVWPARHTWETGSGAEGAASGTQGGTTKAGPGSGPLAGIRVLDLGTILAGPYAGSLLAELGADVLKVEPPEGDSFRVTGFIYNKGMRSLAIDLRDPDGAQAFADLVRSADVVLDNYRAGVLERLHIDYDSLTAINPDVITVSVTGYGEGGPLSAKPGFDPILQGTSGMMAAQGGDDEPVFLTLAINDATAGAVSALGTALALYHRAVSGAGQRVWTSLAGMSALVQSGELTRFAGREPAIYGGRDFKGPSALDRTYATSDGWVRIQTDRSALPALAQLDLISGDTLQRNADSLDDEALTKELTAVLAPLKRDDVARALTEQGIPAVASRAIPELTQDAALMAADLLAPHHLVSGSLYYTPGRYAQFDRTDQKATLLAPGLGEHSREILREIGYAPDRINRLVESGAVVAGDPLRLEAFVSYR